MQPRCTPRTLVAKALDKTKTNTTRRVDVEEVSVSYFTLDSNNWGEKQGVDGVRATGLLFST